ncbi:hypothetical protein AAFF_G00162580 [Aldrovandia affinis]|uniref:Uncharacterized protein n=1 Tax=Aldrovandia affinis TaxID=143900 RepID=A0AAD7WWC7_9TELE|nr:hypothetical protein AAFF_G00162580 [Aldrovandia affinis]
MPKIKPETKVLIIKNLKSKSPAEVADIFNVSKRQVERIRKRYQETGDVHDRPSALNPVTVFLALKAPQLSPQWEGLAQFHGVPLWHSGKCGHATNGTCLVLDVID